MTGSRVGGSIGPCVAIGQRAASRSFQRRNRPLEGGLSATRQADKADKLTLVDGQGHILQRPYRAVIDREHKVQVLGVDDGSGRSRNLHQFQSKNG